ncbi:tetratricopeptide repeat protein [Geitlerinema splendidum]|nr:tetratricopeptide repeat protein [Geitlerinema splendidum]
MGRLTDLLGLPLGTFPTHAYLTEESIVAESNVSSINCPIYERLKVALSLDLRRQIFFAVCDDLTFKNQIAAQLQAELTGATSPNSTLSTLPAASKTASAVATLPLSQTHPRLVSLHLNLSDPNIAAQIRQWLAQHPHLTPIPGFQILGIEKLTRQSPSLQRLFFASLQQMAKNLESLDSSLLLWLPRPWFTSIQQSAPDFWRCHTGIFEFAGDPTPISDEVDATTVPELGGWGNGEMEKPTKSAVAVVAPPPQPQREPPVEAVGSLAPVERYLTLGNSYRDRIVAGDVTPQNLSAAIQAYEQALRALEETSPQVPDILNDLGNLYWLFSRQPSPPEQAQIYLEQALSLYQLALTLTMTGQTYSRLQNNLGAVYADLARYRDPVLNLQNAIAAYQEAVRDSLQRNCTEQLDAFKQYASTQNNLGTAYWNLAQQQNPDANLKSAIAAYQQALKYYTPDRETLSYGMIQNNLGTAFWNLAQYERSPDYLQMAIWSYREALQYRTFSVSATAYAATQNNLGTAYWHLANHKATPILKRAEDLLLCVEAYHAALEAANTLKQQQPPVPLSFDFFATHNNLGLAYFQLATDGKIKATLASTDVQSLAPVLSQVLEKSLEYLESALNHHVIAWQGWTQQAELRKSALSYILQAIKALYQQGGIAGQNQALSHLPSELLPEVMKKL